MQLYGELHRYIPVLAHYRGYRVTELPVNHRPREHGRSNYGVERYVRGFLDLLTVTFMGRYRHRPLHLFGGLGLLFSLLGSAILVYLTIVKLLGHAIGQRPLLLARRPPRRRRHPAALARPHLRADHEPPRGADGRRATGRRASWTKCCVADLDARPLLRHVRPRLPAERAGHLGPARRRRRGARAAPAGLGAAPQLVGRARGRCCASPRPSAACAVAGRRRRRRRAHRRLSRALRPARREARRAGAARRLQPARLALRHARRRPRPLPARVARGAASCASSTGGRSGARTVVVADTEAHAAFFREEFGLAADRVEVCFVGAEDRLFRPGWQPETPFHALFVGKLIPLHGLETILAAAALAPEIPFRVVGSGQLEPLLDDRPANVEWVPWVEYEDLPARSRRAGCALGIFGTSAKAARVIPNKAFQAIACGDAARHRRHARRARAADRRPRRAARAARRPGCARGCRAAARHRPRATPTRSAPRAGRPTRRARARRCSALAGARCSSARSQARDPASRAALGRGRRVRRRDVGAGGAPAAGVRDGPLRRREPDAGRLVDGARPVPRDDRPPGRPDLAPRRALRPARRAPRPALVAVAEPRPAPRRPGRRRRARRRARLPARPQAPRRRVGGPRLRARLPALSADAVARRRRLPSRSRSRRRSCSARSGSSTRTACCRSRCAPAPPA